ncbi:Rieske (2Fe-2S) protein [Chloroflexota bacterium]
MGNLFEVLKTADLASGQMKAVTVAEQEILIAQAGDEYYAASNVCPHRGGRLSEGALSGSIVECPLHASQFDLANGRPLRWLKGGLGGRMVGLFKAVAASNKVRTYRVQLDGDAINIEL